MKTYDWENEVGFDGERLEDFEEEDYTEWYVYDHDYGNVQIYQDHKR